MYAVVGCSECSTLWIVELGSKTSQCPQCGSRRKATKRKTFVETADIDHAREVRASMLANRQGEGASFADVDSFADLEETVEDGLVSDREYLEGIGLDVDEVDAAGEKATKRAGKRTSKAELVERALRELDRPTKNEVVEWMANRGVSEEYVSKALDKLVRNGTVSESQGRYRIV